MSPKLKGEMGVLTLNDFMFSHLATQVVHDYKSKMQTADFITKNVTISIIESN